jgi:uncharacterized membrane protein YphA (DoxX/SURF4 family)
MGAPLTDLLTFGGQAPDLAIALNRVVVGGFFAISGYHKLFNAARHASLVETLKRDRIPCVGCCSWLVPIVEFLGGMLLTIGLGSVISALLLGAVCLVATCTDGLQRVREWHPIDRADWVDTLLYLPEVLYGIMLLTVILTGPERYSLDHLLLTR